jgi:hypothetical protein
VLEKRINDLSSGHEHHKIFKYFNKFAIKELRFVFIGFFFKIKDLNKIK